MQQRFVVPNIYSDMSSETEGYFQFAFHCPICGDTVETPTQRSKIATATKAMDLGIGLLNNFWGRAAEMGEQVFGSKWHAEHDQALQKAWETIKHNYRFCNQCNDTVCLRCWNNAVSLCTRCAPDLKADAATYKHQLIRDALHTQLEQNLQAPQFATEAVPAAVTPDMLRQPANNPAGAAPQRPQNAAPVPIAGDIPLESPCPNCGQKGLTGKFCQHCGTRIPVPDLFCPNCAMPILTKGNFCQECGAPLH
jgi:hypothetical protein